MTDLIFQVRDVAKTYETGAGGFTALKGISFDVQKGEFLGIIGKSGAGKTTLLNMLSGVSEITAGEVLFFPQNTAGTPVKPLSIGAMSQDALALWRGQNMGIVYQSFELMPQLDLVNNIMLPQDFAGQYRAGISRERALELLDIVELGGQANKLPAQISGGQKQRVAIARALVNEPHVIVADEPTGSLDSLTADTIFRIFARLVAQGKTVIMVTHDRELASRFSRRLHISDGRLVDETHVAAPTAAPAAARTDGADTAVAPSAAADTKTHGIADGRSAPLLFNLNTRSDHDTSGPAILLQDVVKTYVNASGSFTALKGINLDIDYGQFVSLVGKSGSGKSTLLNMLTGIDHPTSGQVTIGGQDIYRLSESKRALWRGRNVGIVFQFFQLLPTLTLLENTILPMDYCNVYPYQERPRRAMELLAMVGLEEHAFDLPANVSNGQQQAAAIARSLATDPPIIVADEPTGNLDSRSADVVVRVFQELANRGKTILIVTHDPSLTTRTDRNVIIADGELIDPAIARILSTLDHHHMLQATRAVEKHVYEPGELILRHDDPVDYLYLVTAGQVAVVDDRDTAVAELSAGQFFGEVELVSGGRAIASIRARNTPVQLAMLPKVHFQEIMQESPTTLERIRQVADERRAESLMRRERESVL